ncbi:unnamed protein product [Rangifer tarandus platyrhynchus]|uniref:Uncharacterized protein n=1 Tax=Rangifer tarandus platyrhynchus TaxID=3082113 RepID=A0ABN8XW72_RANTA|nr:unnamed protein product [Rangifer tarandus platyrhynchus]
MSVDVLTLAGMEPTPEAECGVDGMGFSQLTPSISSQGLHRLMFSAQGCPQSIQARLEEASRREEGPPLRPHRWSWTDGGGGSCCSARPFFGMSVLFFDPVSHCGS